MPRDYEQILHDIDVQDKLINKIQKYINKTLFLEYHHKEHLFNYLEQLKGKN